MSFQPSVNFALSIDGAIYHVAEDPARPDRPFARVGKYATVYQLRSASGGGGRALKLVASDGFAARISPQVTIPTSRPLSTTGSRRMPCSFNSLLAAGKGVSGDA